MTYRYPLFRPNVAPDVGTSLADVFASGGLTQGTREAALEALLTHILGAPVVLTNSCTSALDLAAHLVPIKPNSVVLTTAQTCAATNSVFVHRGAILAWVDVDPMTGNITQATLERWFDENPSLSVQHRISALVTVDWGGRACTYDSLRVTLDRRLHPGIPIIEDAAHACGTHYKQVPIAANGGDFVCFLGATPIATETGSKRIDQVRVGDRVRTATGVHPVTAVHERMYDGMWTRLKVGQQRLVMTANHPVKVYRDGVDLWVRADEVQTSDKVYVLTKPCVRCTARVPFYGTVCRDCFDAADSGLPKRQKLQARQRKHTRATSRLAHHFRDVEPVMEEWRARGYRVVTLIHALPDFIAIRDGRITAVEIESACSVRLGKSQKYAPLDGVYDDVVWVTRPKQRFGSRYAYTIVGELARVPVAHVSTRMWRSNHGSKSRVLPVYNLTVADDPTYFARGILVHNCFSFQAIKHLTTGDGGALVCRDPALHERARKLKWFGIDRDLPGPRFMHDIEEIGFKYHMNDIAAAIGLANVKELPATLAAHRDNARRLWEPLLSAPRVEMAPFDYDSTYWFFPLLTDQRDSLVEVLDAAGIESSQVHRRNDSLSAFRRASLVAHTSFPGLDSFSRRQLNLPCGRWMPPDAMREIADVIMKWARA